MSLFPELISMQSRIFFLRSRATAGGERDSSLYVLGLIFECVADFHRQTRVCYQHSVYDLLWRIMFDILSVGE